VILDTNALYALVDGDSAIESVLRQHERWCLPVIVLGEFRYGIIRSRYRDRYEGWLQQYLPLYEVIPILESTTHQYADLRSLLRKSGTPIPANDVWIASLAMEHDLPILSRDVHFDVVPGINRKDW
jgi:predicted nucleic acid-binding protein